MKTLDVAKSRLLPADDPTRGDLALAFATDCTLAVSEAALVGHLVLVSQDALVRALAEDAGAHWLPEPGARGLNAAAAHGVAHCPPGPVAIVAGDLPCLTPDAVDLVLGLAAAHSSAFVSDAQGTGTTMLLAADHRISPAFGERSRARHAAGGAVDLGLELDAAGRTLLARARRDVDMPVDLADAVRIGVGPATRRTLDERAGNARGARRSGPLVNDAQA